MYAVSSSASPAPAADDTGAALSAASSSIAPSVTTVASLVPLSNAKALAQASPEASTAAGTSTSSSAAGEGGLPQLRIEHWGGQMIWLAVIFTVFYIFMARIFVPRLRKVIDNRGTTIAEDLANARANRDEAEAQARLAAAEMAAAHSAARKLASEAITRSNAEIAALESVEDGKLNIRLGEAETRIRASRDAAMAHVAEIASETASAIVAKLSGKAATAASLKSAFEKV